MSWFWSLPLIPLVVCGAVCIGALIVAFVVGRVSTYSSPRPSDVPEREDVT